MKQKHLLIMCGLSGSGKSTWADNFTMSGNDSTAIHISRDKIRFSLVNENEPYFKREKAVFNEFIARITKALNDPDMEWVIADATHLNWPSRRKLLQNLNLDGVKVIPVFMTAPYRVAVERNAQRTGREKLENKVLQDQWERWTDPSNDPYEYDVIWYVNSQGELDTTRKEGREKNA